MQKLILVLALLSIISSNGIAQKEVKRQIGLNLMQKYSPESYSLIQAVEELSQKKVKGVMMLGNSDFTKWLSGNSEEKIVGDIGTAVHEISHSYTFRHPIINQSAGFGEDVSSYFLGQNETIIVKHTEIINTFKISQEIPKVLRTFRYGVYLEPKQMLSAQKDGVYGLLNEWTAYYNGCRMNIDLYDYYLERSDSEGMEIMLEYISNLSSIIMAHYEFRFYTLFYLDAIKTKDRSIYTGILNNPEFVELFGKLDHRFENLIKVHEINKQKIIKNAQSQGLSAYDQDDYFFIGDRGVGLFKEDSDKLIQEMQKSKYQQIILSLSASR